MLQQGTEPSAFRFSTSLRIATALLLVVPSSGCLAAVAGAGVGYVVTQQVLPNDAHVAQVTHDVDVVWESAQETMRILIDPGSELGIQEYPRALKARVDGATVFVDVEAHDLDRTLIRVKAEKYLGPDDATATEVMEALLRRLG